MPRRTKGPPGSGERRSAPSVEAQDRHRRRADDSWLEEIDELLGVLSAPKVQDDGGVVPTRIEPELISCPPVTVDIGAQAGLVPGGAGIGQRTLRPGPRRHLGVLDGKIDAEHVVPLA